jgi:hypothetical protein
MTMTFRSTMKFAAAVAITAGLAFGAATPAHAISRPLGVTGEPAIETNATSGSSTISDAAISSETVLAHADSLENEDGSLDAAKAANNGGAQSLGALLALVGSILVGSINTTMQQL